MSNLKWITVTGGSKEYTREELSETFDRVASQRGWKYEVPEQIIPIDKLIITAEAIRFFCGSVTHVAVTDDGTCWIKAPGYYLSVGA